jgi:hypothetical protein
MPIRNKTQRKKHRLSRRKRIVKKGGGSVLSKPIAIPEDEITKDDILYEDYDVRILKPDVKKGILVFTHYTQPLTMPSLCESGIKTGAQLKKEGINFGRSVYHPYIFFRAPSFSRNIDYSSIDAEIKSSYGERILNLNSLIWIRIDPEKTNVYSSEIRAKFAPPIRYGTPQYFSEVEHEVYKSRKTMTEYLGILEENEEIKNVAGMERYYNLYKSSVRLFPKTTPELRFGLKTPSFFGSGPKYPWNSVPIHVSSEVLVRIPHLTPNYFVKCT